MKVKLLFIVVLALSALLPTLQGGTHRETLTANSITDRSGIVANSGANFTEVWSAPNGTLAQNEDGYQIAYTGLNLWLGNYIVERVFFVFDTTELKKHHRVESANLQVKVSGIGGLPSWTAKIQKWLDTDDILGLDDYTAFDNFFYDDGSMEREDFVIGEWNNIPIRDDNLFVKKGETKLCLRISKEIEAYEPSHQVALQIWSGVKLEINYVWATGRVRPRGINPLFFVVGGSIIVGGISFVAIQRKKLRRLYS